MRILREPNFKFASRRGAVAPLFAVLLPGLFALCGFAINTAYLQLTSTELKIATDVAAHAGGRAMSLEQSTQAAWDTVAWAASLNEVAGQPMTIPANEDHIQFGQSVRGENGHGKYDFDVVSRSAIDSGAEPSNSISVIGTVNMPLVFRALPGIQEFNSSRRSTATQVDRDIALILDRSGSMLYHNDDNGLTEAIEEIYETTTRRYFWRWSRSRGWYIAFVDERLITLEERDAALRSLYNRRYTDNLIEQLHNYGTEFGEYADDWMDNRSYSRTSSTGAPRHSRWAFLLEGVDAFTEVLELTDQEELVSLSTFESVATSDVELTANYQEIHDAIENISPFGGTAIGTGMETGLPPIINGSRARPFAAKTIVVLTDGDSNNGRDPADVVRDIRLNNSVTIHTVTFSDGALQAPMQEVARLGGGQHYHADTGNVLIDIFEEIANNLPTILTQ